MRVMMDVGRRLREARNKKRMSIQEVSSVLNWPISKLSKIERGDQVINIDDLKLLMKVLNIDIREIIYNDREIILESPNEN